ncbi:MAG: peptidase MA family metallohydrolase [Nitrospiraceae bacterium]
MAWVVRLVAVALSLLPLVSLAAELPPLVFEAPARFASLASRLQQLNPHAVHAAMELVGLQEPGPPISITLAPEDSEIARQAPSWVSGYALAPSGRIVLFPDRQVSYPYGSLEGLLLHELTHVFVLRMTGSQTVPRWFGEGLAMVASGERDLGDLAWGFWIGLTATPTSLEEINRLFGENPPSIQKAYLLSEALVRYLMASLGPDIPRRILGERAGGVPFEDAVRTVTGRSLRELEREFWTQQTAWRRWIPVATSSAILWVAIVLLALAALRKQRQRAAALKREWEEEEDEP